jgi:prepilin peptidase CpaA
MWNALFHHPLPLLQWGVVLATALVAASTDLRDRRIPNLLTGPVFVGGLGVAAGLGGWAGLADALLASAIAALPFVFLFAFAAGGAGDAKLMAALGAWLGSIWGSLALVLVCLSGVLLGVLQAAHAGRLEAVLANVSGAARGLCVPFFARSPGGDGSAARLDTLRASLPATQGALVMPYGLAIASGMLLTAGGAWLWNAA